MASCNAATTFDNPQVVLPVLAANAARPEGKPKRRRLLSIQAFADEIIALVRASAVEVVNAALGGTAIRGSRGRAVSARMATRPKGTKRDPAAIARLTETLGTFIKKKPGQSIERIGKALGISTKELVLPVKKLLAAKQISTKGHRRSTTYYPR